MLHVYSFYLLDPRGMLSGLCLMDTATSLAIMITTERLKAQIVKDRESIELGHCSEHRAAYIL